MRPMAPSPWARERMISLSDLKHLEFLPLDVTRLESFNDERFQKSLKTQPDFQRFKLLLDPADLKGDVSFKALIPLKSDSGGHLFESLALPAGPLLDQVPGQESPQTREPGSSVENPVFEQGYAQGFEQGLAQGEETGRVKGFEQGCQQGEAEGFVKGEAQGFDKGYQEGLEKAQADIQEQARQILDPLKVTLTTADGMLDQLVDNYEAQILALIFKISQKAVMASLKMDDEIVKHTILDALKHLVTPEEIIVNVSSEDYDYIEMVKDEFFQAIESLKHVRVTSDPLIHRGGCKIETATASIATDPESKLNAVYEALINAGPP